jgi:type IV fimbrial biogenesis protein FimT
LKTWRGFSLVELIVGVAILGVLLAIAMPAFSNWLRNAKVRTAAESVQNGLQLARAEAVRRNTTVGFRLVDRADESCALIANDLSTSVWNWVVSIRSPAGKCQIAPVAEDADPSDDALADNPFIIQSRSGAEGSSAATLKTNQSALVFNSLGRLTQVPPLPPGSPAGSIPHVRIEVESATGEPCRADDGPIRCLWIMVTLGGQIRMCDPALAASDAQGGCP